MQRAGPGDKTGGNRQKTGPTEGPDADGQGRLLPWAPGDARVQSRHQCNPAQGDLLQRG